MSVRNCPIAARYSRAPRRVVAAPFSLAGTQVEQHASIGVDVWEGTSKDCTELLQNADVAMYEAKRRGEGRHVVFTPAMYEDADNHFALTRELGHALQSGEISMHYQPIVNLATSEVVGFEALMKIDRSFVSPSHESASTTRFSRRSSRSANSST